MCQRQVATEQEHMGARLRNDGGFDNDDNIEQIGKVLTPNGHLVNIGLHAILG